MELHHVDSTRDHMEVSTNMSQFFNTTVEWLQHLVPIHQLKYNKTAGKDGIAAELIEFSCLFQLNMVARIWQTEQPTDE